MTNARYVTLRHAISGMWCIEAPHPQYDVPQPYFIGNRHSFKRLSDAVAWIEKHGCVVVRNLKTKQRMIYQNGRPMVDA